MAKLVDKFYKDKNSNVFNFSYTVLAMLLLITIGTTYLFYQSAKSKDVIRFKSDTDRFQLAIGTRIGLYIALLNGGRGFIENTNDLSREKFEAYADSLDLKKNYKGLKTLGFVKTVALPDTPALIEKMKLDNFPEFKLQPEGVKPSYETLLYVHPLDENTRRAIGFDMSSEPTRYDALKRAKDSKEAAATGPVVPVTTADDADKRRIIIFLPVKGESVSASQASIGAPIRGDTVGYVYGSFIVEKFMEEIFSEVNNKQISVKIYDTEVSDANLLVQTNDAPQTGFINVPNEFYARQDDIKVGGRNWKIEYGSLSSFNTQSSLGWTPLMFITGVCISFLLFGMTYWEASARAKLQRTAGELFETQKQKEQLFEEEKKSRLAAEQANMAKDEFIAIISHELKTPLNAIAGWARILKTHDISEATKETALNKIDKNLRAQAGLVEQLLTYSDVLSESLDIDDTEVIFGDIVAESISEITPGAEEKEIEIVINNSLNGEAIAGDKDRLKIVFSCILRNAIKFTQAGGRIETDLSRMDNMVQFSVSDNGRGIAPEFLPLIFDQYKQADTPNIRDYGGLGLGLTISKHIVELHHGTIIAESDGKGKGSKFTIRFPEKNGNGN